MYMYMYMHMHVSICICACVCVCVCVYMYVYICICIYVCVYMYMYICICIYVYVYGLFMAVSLLFTGFSHIMNVYVFQNNLAFSAESCSSTQNALVTSPDTKAMFNLARCEKHDFVSARAAVANATHNRSQFPHQSCTARGCCD